MSNYTPDFDICRLCKHLKEHHQKFHFGTPSDFGWELACSGLGKKWFSHEQKCRCWKFEPLNNLEYLEGLYEQKNTTR